MDNNGFIALCIEDAEVNSISDISVTCVETNETDFTSCLGNSSGVTIAGITCKDTGTKIIVSNLSYSGIRGTLPAPVPVPSSGGGGGGGIKAQCNDNKDNDADGLVDLDDPGCESKYDNDEYNEPVEEFEVVQGNWICNEWSECRDGKRYRDCALRGELTDLTQQITTEILCDYSVEINVRLPLLQLRMSERLQVLLVILLIFVVILAKTITTYVTGSHPYHRKLGKMKNKVSKHNKLSILSSRLKNKRSRK